MDISQFSNIYQSKDGVKSSILDFLNNVKFGTWKDQVELVRKAKNKKEREELKKQLPYVTLSGLFNERRTESLIKHSGFIGIDIDNLTADELLVYWPKITSDKYTYAAFKSVSGFGLCIVVKIDPSRHLEAFLGLERYYLEQYQIFIDKACKDVTRPRYVTYDENIHVSESDAVEFKSYIPKSEATLRIAPIISGKDDVDHVIHQICERKIDITGSYSRWLSLGFAIASEFRHNGRDYYHAISQFSPKYSKEKADKQYDHCIKYLGQGDKQAGIATFFHFAKEANLSLLTDKTKQIIAVSVQAKRGGRDAASAQTLLHEIIGISPDESKEVVDKVFKSNIETATDLSIIDQLEFFLKSNFNLKRNEITRYVENAGSEIDTVFVNSVWRRATKEVDDRCAFETIDRLIASDFVGNYNPIKEWLEKQQPYTGPSLLHDLAKCIDTDTGNNPLDPYPEYKYVFIKKWMVGIIASVYGGHSPLLLVLCGEKQNTGKTYFFRHLLPEVLWPYYAESKLDAGKDDEILMTQKLVIMDDEMGGKSKQESKKLKEMTSKDYFTLREPYGRKNVRLRRMAVLCGTSNDNHLLSDPTGNRRIIPVHVNAIDHKAFNAINKEHLLVEAYQEYKNKYRWELNREDIEKLNKNTTDFEQVSIERELIHQYFRKPTYEGGEDIKYFTNTQIKVYLEEKTKQRISSHKLGMELKSESFRKRERKIDGISSKVYELIVKDAVPKTFTEQQEKAEGIVEEQDLPF